MTDTKKTKREQLKERFLADYKTRLETWDGNVTKFSLGDEALDVMLDTALDFMLLEQPKEATRTKTFRFPTDLLDWLEQQATTNGRSPNAELTEVLRNAKTAA